MRFIIKTAIIFGLLSGLSSCSSQKFTVTDQGASAWVDPVIESYNPMKMDLDSEPILYTIDISTDVGRMKLNKLTLDQARKLALVEAIITNKCATLFQPQYTHLMEKGKVLRVSVYGYPARYKAAN